MHLHVVSDHGAATTVEITPEETIQQLKVKLESKFGTVIEPSFSSY